MRFHQNPLAAPFLRSNGGYATKVFLAFAAYQFSLAGTNFR
jgi:hypothetical protein